MKTKNPVTPDVPEEETPEEEVPDISPSPPEKTEEEPAPPPPAAAVAKNLTAQITTLPGDPIHVRIPETGGVFRATYDRPASGAIFARLDGGIGRRVLVGQEDWWPADQ